MPPRIRFVARFPGAIEGHAVNQIRRLYPSLCAEYEFEDLMQEAYIVFMKCKAKYPHIDNAAWFMSIFSVSLRNKLLNMVARCGRTVSLEALQDTGSKVDELVQEADGFARAVLSELPAAVKEMVRQVCFAPDAEGRAALHKLETYFASTT